MSSSEGPPEYALATSPLQMLAGVVITLSAHLEASAQLLREASKLTADCRSTPRSLRFYAFSNSRKSATALPALEEILEVVLDIAIESDTMEAEAQALALIFLNRALLSIAVRANTALLLLPGNWELLWLSCVILSAKSYYVRILSFYHKKSARVPGYVRRCDDVSKDGGQGRARGERGRRGTTSRRDAIFGVTSSGRRRGMSRGRVAGRTVPCTMAMVVPRRGKVPS